jgi:hypothetical protein
LDAARERAALRFTQSGAAMAADVVKRTCVPVPAPNDDDARPGHVAADERAPHGHLFEASDRNPHCGEDAIHLGVKPHLVRIHARRQRVARDFSGGGVHDA